MYETLGWTPEQIQEELGYDLSSIKAVLMQFSSLFKEQDKKGEVEEITDEEKDEILAAYKRIALYGENEHIRERALRFLFNEKKGRNDGRKVIKQDKTINIVVFNENLLKARKAKQKFLSESNDIVNVDVEKVACG